MGTRDDNVVSEQTAIIDFTLLVICMEKNVLLSF